MGSCSQPPTTKCPVSNTATTVPPLQPGEWLASRRGAPRKGFSRALPEGACEWARGCQGQRGAARSFALRANSSEPQVCRLSTLSFLLSWLKFGAEEAKTCWQKVLLQAWGDCLYRNTIPVEPAAFSYSNCSPDPGTSRLSSTEYSEVTPKTNPVPTWSNSK